jgi:hypothetical protein
MFSEDVSNLQPTVPGTCRGCSSFVSFSKISDAFHVLFDPLANHRRPLSNWLFPRVRMLARPFEPLFGKIRALLRHLPSSIGNHFLHRSSISACRRTRRCQPSAIYSLGELDVLPVHGPQAPRSRRLEVELALSLVKSKPASAGSAFSVGLLSLKRRSFQPVCCPWTRHPFSRFDIVGYSCPFRRFAVLDMMFSLGLFGMSSRVSRGSHCGLMQINSHPTCKKAPCTFREEVSRRR